ncbi:MAG: cysteine hydrolase [Clostridia bacterium]|nr:cysteine hydrolase [Clostridia bacterium]
MANKFLIVVDMQNDFIDAALGSAQAQAIVPAVVDRIRAARMDGETIIATLDTHAQDYLSTPEGRKLPVEHCIKGTEGWKIRDEIVEAMGDAILLEKPTFGSVRLPELIGGMMEEPADTTIELLGLCTDICVVSNTLLLKAHYPDARIVVREACCAGVTVEKHLAALETMRSCQIDVI